MLGGAKPPISDRSARAVARGAQKAEREGGGSWGDGSQLEVWGSAASSPSGIQGTAPTAKRFSCILV